jgi:hypothetical protein
MPIIRVEKVGVDVDQQDRESYADDRYLRSHEPR